MGQLNIPAIYAAIALEHGALDQLVRQARFGDLRLIRAGERLPNALVMESGDGVDAASLPGFLIDLARLGLAAVRGAYATPGSPIGDLVSEEVTRMRVVGLALPADPGALPKNGD